jgi:hypothetical protein
MAAILRGMKSGVAESVIRLEELFKKPLENIPILITPSEEKQSFWDNISLPNPPQISVGSFRNHN